jgi:enamine deaminase RidA (YjgF/YER057c/UK114 family)
MKVEIDIEAVMPDDDVPIERLRPFNTADWFSQPIRRDSCMAVKAGEEIYLRGQTGATLDGSQMIGEGHSVHAAHQQAHQIMENASRLLGEAGASLDDVCKLKVYIGDRAYREAVYQAIGAHFGDTHPCSTGLIVRGFARPQILCELDMSVTLNNGQPHQRIRPFATRQWYRDGQDLRCKFSMATRAGNRVYLRGQTGMTLDGEFVGHGSAGAQANQAMLNVKQVLQEAGASMSEVCRISTYIKDRAHRHCVYRAIGEHMRGVYPVGTGLIVNGFANPDILVEVDVEAVIS